MSTLLVEFFFNTTKDTMNISCGATLDAHIVKRKENHKAEFTHYLFTIYAHYKGYNLMGL